MINSTQIQYIRTYSIAQWIRDLVIENDPSEYLYDYLEINANFIKKALKPSKVSLLHQFILEKLVVDFEYESRKWADCGEWNLLTEKHLGYTLDCDKFNDRDSDYKDQIEKEIIDKILPKVSDEVFYLLFNDREFLFYFNKFVSEKVKELSKENFPKLLQRDGIVNRINNWPKWLQKAIFYRDRGLCCSCYKDVSGLLNTQNIIHLDHIIPLREGGTNDTSNIQLLCDNCNLKKSSKLMTGKYLYIRPY